MCTWLGCSHGGMKPITGPSRKMKMVERRFGMLPGRVANTVVKILIEKPKLKINSTDREGLTSVSGTVENGTRLWSSCWSTRARLTSTRRTSSVRRRCRM
jgi:hypothetical protein